MHHICVHSINLLKLQKLRKLISGKCIN